MPKLTPAEVKTLRAREGRAIDLVKSHGSDIESNQFVRVAAVVLKEHLEVIRLALKQADLEPQRFKARVEADEAEDAEVGEPAKAT